MKYTLILLSLLTTSFAFGTTITCTSHEDTIKVQVDSANGELGLIEVYNQGGLGPNYLESQYIANNGTFVQTNDNAVIVQASFLTSGKLDIYFSDISREGSGSIKFPGAKARELKDCSIE